MIAVTENGIEYRETRGRPIRHKAPAIGEIISYKHSHASARSCIHRRAKLEGWRYRSWVVDKVLYIERLT